MGLKNTYQARKRFTKTPVKSTGMWYQDGDVIVPSNQITMKGPQGQPNYFNSPILGVGMQSGETKVMQPGREYLFPNDASVYETKMQRGGISGEAEVAFDLTSMVPGPIGMTASGLGLFNDLYQGDWLGVGMNTANILTGGTSKALMSTARIANNAGARNAARVLASGSHSINRTSKTINSYTKPIDTTKNLLNTPYFPTQRGGYQDNTRVAPVVRPVKPKMQTGGQLPEDYEQFKKFQETLPNNLKDPNYKYNDPNSYDLYGMWNASDKPSSFFNVKDSDLFPLQDDGTYHGFSVSPKTGEFLKPKNHPSTWMEVYQAQFNPDLQNQAIIQNEKGRLQYVPRTMQMGGTQPSNFERIEQVHIKSKQDPWYKRYPRMVGRAIDNKLSDFGHQYAQRISNATGGSEWYKQSNPFMNVALESMNAPQLAATYAVTGKVQTPSEAMDIQNPYGAFVVDALLDPSTALTLGSRTASRLATSGIDALTNQVTKQIRKSPKLSFALDQGRYIKGIDNLSINPGLEPRDIRTFKEYMTTSPKGVLEKDFLEGLGRGAESIDNSLQKRVSDLKSKEGFNRLVDQERNFLIESGETSYIADELAPINARARIEELENVYNINRAAAKEAESSITNDSLSKYSKDNFLFSNAYYNKYNPNTQSSTLSKQSSKGINLDKTPPILSYTEAEPGSIAMGYNLLKNKPIEMHEIAHALQRGRVLPLDDELRQLAPKSSLRPTEKRAYDYFKKGSKGKEVTPFANELRESMFQAGFIPDYYSPISENQVQQAYKYFKKNPMGSYNPKTGDFLSNTRIFDFMAPTKENSKLLTDVLNKLPAAAPIGAGIGVGASQINKKKYGGLQQSYKKTKRFK